MYSGFPVGSAVKNPSANAGDSSSIPGSGRSPEGINGNPLQYSCLENPMDIGALWALVRGVAKSRARLIAVVVLSLLRVSLPPTRAQVPPRDSQGANLFLLLITQVA